MSAISGQLDIEAIKAILPHRYPFLLLDRIVELVPGERIVGIKNVTANEPFFQGHFPDFAVMPGVLVVEAMAQAGAAMMLKSMEDSSGKVPFLAAIDNAKFRRPVVPGDQLRLELNVLRRRGVSCKLDGKAFVGEELAAQAEILAVLGDDASAAN
jgi:beta-hydroxyacyl-ACP dehydratase FabZ